MKTKKLYSTVCGIFLLAALSACGQNAQTGEEKDEGMVLSPSPVVLSAGSGTVEQSADSDIQAPILTPTPALTPTPTLTSTLAPTPVPVSVWNSAPVSKDVSVSAAKQASVFDSRRTYREISPAEGITVYFNDETNHEPGSDSWYRIVWTEAQIIIRTGENYHVIRWTHYLDEEFYLSFGDPIVTIKEGCYAGLKCDKLLSIVIPTARLTEAVSPTGAYEVYGREYVLDYQALADGKEVKELEVIPGGGVRIMAGYRDYGEGERIFALTFPDWLGKERRYKPDGIFWYPGLELPEQESYSLVYEGASHFTENGNGYRRVGVVAGNEIVYLGKFCNNVFFPEEGKGYYSGWGYDHGVEEPHQAWQPRLLEPETLLDLDGDGVAEKLSYRVAGDENDRNFVVTINGTETVLDSCRKREFFGNYMFTASMDGKTNQLLVLTFEHERSELLTFYSYIDGRLCRAGQFRDANYRMTEKDGRWVYRVFKSVAALQRDRVILEYSLVDGILQELPQEYYEFREMQTDGSGKRDRNILTILQDFELYEEKGGEKTFVLPAGSHVVTLGGDLGDWILVENRDTGEQGWLKVKGRQDASDGEYSYSAFDCVGSNGTEIDCMDLFDNLLMYD
ncbi:MAG: hypothetical protein K2N94_03860 [Lachnospiraceae bacterium]|nr:hypothetical protein [Lachnospiraceae bacterium]